MDRLYIINKIIFFNLFYYLYIMLNIVNKYGYNLLYLS